MAKNRVTKKSIASVINTLAANFDSELYAKTNQELEGYWFFKFDKDAPLELNIYKFHDRLKLYGSFCRRWEEHHNGTCCVVERVRDKYLMPKISQLVEDIKKCWLNDNIET